MLVSNCLGFWNIWCCLQPDQQKLCSFLNNKWEHCVTYSKDLERTDSQNIELLIVKCHLHLSEHEARTEELRFPSPSLIQEKDNRVAFFEDARTNWKPLELSPNHLKRNPETVSSDDVPSPLKVKASKLPEEKRKKSNDGKERLDKINPIFHHR